MLGAAVAFMTREPDGAPRRCYSVSARRPRCSARSNTEFSPSICAENELVAGNGAIEATTFLSILLRHGRGRCAHPARQRHEPCRRHGIAVAVIGRLRGPVDTERAAGRSLTQDQREPAAADLAHRAAGRVHPTDLALHPRPVLVLGGRRDPAHRIPDDRPRRAACQRQCRDAAADGVRDRRRHRIDAVRATAQGRSVAPSRAVCGARHLDLLLGLRVRNAWRRGNLADAARCCRRSQGWRLSDRSVCAVRLRRCVQRAALRNRPAQFARRCACAHDRGQQRRRLALFMVLGLGRDVRLRCGADTRRRKC